MPLSAGTRLGPYAIEELLGEGGMGQVYRARDTNLERDVAIKVLPDVWALDPDRLARFRREAQLLASLNHPHIAQIYGVETAAAGVDPTRTNTTALVMELVEGPTLADCISAGPLSVPEALAIARQIADALDAAHEHGVIHRDLKPANVKVREDGTVKVLDFGLAKAVGPAVAVSSSPSISPTITSPAMTAMGMILGTASYMSPEQARGKAVDKRTDIWAFGCILFEMLAGRRPFDGEDVTEVLASVVRAEPAWAMLPSGVPPPLVRFLRRCLEKDRRLRLRDIGDARLDLAEDAAAPAPGPAPTPQNSTRERLAWLAAVVVMTTIAAGAWLLRPSLPHPGPITRFSIVLPQGQRFTGALRHVAVSPDGGMIVYAATGGLYRRALNDPEPHLIQGTNENATHPEFSPDGRSIAYIALDPTGQTYLVKRVPTAGGTPVKILDLGAMRDPGGWNPLDTSLRWTDDQIIGTGSSGIWSVPASGDTPQTLVSVDSAVEGATSPQLIDSGRRMLFTVRHVGASGPEAFSVVAQLIGSETRKVLVTAGRSGVALASGHLVYLRGADLMAVAFDERRVEVTGDPIVVATGMSAHMAISSAGTMAYQMTAAADLRSPVWVDRHGREEAIAMPPQNVALLRLSPDGSRLAMTGGSEIRVWSFERSTMTRLSEADTGQWDAAWMPDGRRLVFSAGRSVTASPPILVKAADGSGAATTMTPDPGGFPNAVSPDGKFLVSHRGAGELMLQQLNPSGPPRQLVKGLALNATFSPDGHWIAYQAAESGRTDVFVRAFPDTEAGRWQVSSGGGKYPVWSSDGRELFFISAADALTVVSVEARGGFATGPPLELFRTNPYVADSNSRPFDISRDGKRFVFLKISNDVRPTINVVTHWFEEVVAKVRSQSVQAR
jgi:eukaryotic-like serine/threonine-protein kinase